MAAVEKLRSKLKANSNFGQLSDAQLESALQAFKIVACRKGEIITREKDNADHFFIVIEGECEILTMSGEDTVLTAGDEIGVEEM